MNYRSVDRFRHLFSRQKCLLDCLKNVNSVRHLFYESDPKGEYKKEDKIGFFTHVKDGWKELKSEIELFKSELKEKFISDPVLAYYPGTIDKKWDFKSQSDLDKWIATSDSDNNEGYSSCEFTLSRSGCGLFTGTLDTRIPKDGRVKRAGFCAIRSQRVLKSFKRDDFIDWSPYTHLVVRLRGDGRSYMINIAMCGYYDQLWNDVYHYALYTRGGPYWQVAKIPFSKFMFASKGRIQDRQDKLDLEAITSVGFTCSDKINGPFSLEIDYIGCEFNPIHDEEFAYEMYKLPQNIAAT